MEIPLCKFREITMKILSKDYKIQEIRKTNTKYKSNYDKNSKPGN